MATEYHRQNVLDHLLDRISRMTGSIGGHALGIHDLLEYLISMATGFVGKNVLAFCSHSRYHQPQHLRRNAFSGSYTLTQFQRIIVHKLTEEK